MKLSFRPQSLCSKPCLAAGVGILFMSPKSPSTPADHSISFLSSSFCSKKGTRHMFQYSKTLEVDANDVRVSLLPSTSAQPAVLLKHVAVMMQRTGHREHTLGHSVHATQKFWRCSNASYSSRTSKSTTIAVCSTCGRSARCPFLVRGTGKISTQNVRTSHDERGM